MTTHDLHWTFGHNCHISFPGGGEPVVEPGGCAITTDEGCASITDNNGDLLFYTDGATLYNGAHLPVGSSLGGSGMACQSAIIIPPAGTGSLYHVFTVMNWENSGAALAGVLNYTAVSVSGGSITPSATVKLDTFGPKRAAEKLAAVAHADCNKYWVVSLDNVTNLKPLCAMLIDSDLGPSALATVYSPYPWTTDRGFYTKFSPDGARLAVVSNGTIDILNFDRATGLFTAHSQVTGCVKAYGVEFSPNGQHLYFTNYDGQYVKRHTIGAAGTSTPAPTTNIGAWTSGATAGALQLAPNGKIYGTLKGTKTLLEIGDPDNAVPTAVDFHPAMTATDGNGKVIELESTGAQGLPTFPLIPKACADRCRNLAAAVDELLTERGRELQNHMVTCAGEAPVAPSCSRLDIPEIRPQTYVSWGDSRCDCIEGDDTEVMQLTLCNPYSNLTLSGLTVHELVIVDDAGQPVPKLPNGDPSIQLVPIGPYCFGDIAPCSCVTREFVLRLRGAPGGRYRVLVRGICFDASIHGDTEACFAFEVCPD